MIFRTFMSVVFWAWCAMFVLACLAWDNPFLWAGWASLGITMLVADLICLRRR